MSLSPHFTLAELACKHTGKCDMQPDFLARLERLRVAYGKPMKISSGYRDPSHPAEARKTATGAHAMGRAVDVAVQGADAVRLIELALAHGFTGIGVSQKGAGRFIHIDDAPGLPRPAVWSY